MTKTLKSMRASDRTTRQLAQMCELGGETQSGVIARSIEAAWIADHADLHRRIESGELHACPWCSYTAAPNP